MDLLDYGVFYSDKDHCFIFVSTGSYWKEIDNYKSIIDYNKSKKRNTFFFINPWHFKHGENYYNFFKLNGAKSIIFCNEIEECLYFNELGIPNIHINQNCWLDYNLFNITNCKKKYDLIYNGCNSSYKNHYLLEDTEKYKKVFLYYKTQENIDLKKFKPKKIYCNVNARKVVNTINQSNIGIVLSELEGACYASSEYLLCGLPVISIANKGGRNFWYNNYNSVTIEKDRIQLLNAIDSIKSNCHLYSPEKIRYNHILRTLEVRKKFYDFMKVLFLQNKINKEPAKVFEVTYFNKMIKTDTVSKITKEIDKISLIFNN
jgi:hypothetical protein